jgi:zinc transporter ZupT
MEQFLAKIWTAFEAFGWAAIAAISGAALNLAAQRMNRDSPLTWGAWMLGAVTAIFSALVGYGIVEILGNFLTFGNPQAVVAMVAGFMSFVGVTTLQTYAEKFLKRAAGEKP